MKDRTQKVLFKRKNTNIQHITTEILVQCFDEMTKESQQTLPSIFGSMIDGWSWFSTKLIAFVACFKGSNRLLTLSPLLKEENLDADSHAELNTETLSLFHKSVDNVNFFNC